MPDRKRSRSDSGASSGANSGSGNKEILCSPASRKNKPSSSWSDWNGWSSSWGSSWNNWNWSWQDVEDRCWGPAKEGNYDFSPADLNCSAPHVPVELRNAVTDEDMAFLREVWDQYHDNLDCPKLKAKPILSPAHLTGFHQIVMKTIQEVANAKNCSLCLDQATISATSSTGHKRHADNLVFGVWRYGYRVYAPIEVEIEQARQDGAEVWWRPNTTSHRNFAISLNLVDPKNFEGGTVSFYNTLGATKPYASYKADAGCGIAFCGCDKCIHEVEGVTSGFRLCLLIWTRLEGTPTPPKSQTTHYHRSGTGNAVWLTLADLAKNLRDIVVHPCSRTV